MMRTLLLLAIIGIHAEDVGANKCLDHEISENMTVMVGECANTGTRPLSYRLGVGTYKCMVTHDHHMTVPAFAGEGSCTLSCPAGHKIGLRPAFLLSGGSEPPPHCEECHPNHYSVGGGRRIEMWPTPPLPLPEQFFETKCFGFNQSRYLETKQLNDGWVEGYDCNPWTAKHDGTSLASGWNGATGKVRSELRLRLNMVRRGSVTFTYRVDADTSPQAGSECPWMEGHTGSLQWECMDGTFGNYSADCNSHGGRGRCPVTYPWMCGQPNQCADNLDFCCGSDCEAFGGNRLCPGSGGLQLMVCNESRVRSCYPAELRPLPFSRRYYISSQLQWTSATIVLEAGWQELVWAYLRDGAVLGNDIAEILDVSWEGTDFADTQCTKCPHGKHSRAGSSRCTDCPAGTVFVPHQHACEPCPPEKYALMGMDKCLDRAECTVSDYMARYSECQAGHNKRSKTWEWVEPKICRNGVSLPIPNHELVECEPCKLGEKKEFHLCVACPDGHYGHILNECSECRAGNEARKQVTISHWGPSLPSDFATGCVGLCSGDGWRSLEDHVDSGATHMPPFESYLEYTVNSSIPVSVSFTYSLVCQSAPTTLFEFRINGRKIPLAGTCGGVDLEASAMVPSGMHSLRWVFAETGDSTGSLDAESRAIIRKLRIESPNSGSASSCTPCPAGYFSSSPSAACSPCPVGTTSGAVNWEGGGTQCLPCPEGWFAPVAGSPQCRRCGVGTTSKQGAAQCSCDFTVGKTNSSVDLSFLDKVMGPIAVADAWHGVDMVSSSAAGALFFSICAVQAAGQDGAVVASAYPQGCVGTYACMTSVNDDAPVPVVPRDGYAWPTKGMEYLGDEVQSGGAVRGFEPLPGFLDEYDEISTYDSSGTRWRVGGGLTVVLSDGAQCGDGGRWETRIYLICDLIQGEGTPRLMASSEVPGSGACSRHILWKTAYGCPACTKSSYAEMSTPCIGGMANISYKMSDECFQGVSVPPPRSGATCFVDWRNMLTTADFVAMGALAVGALFAGCILLERYLVYKRLYETYSSLQEGGEVVLDNSEAL